MSCPEFTIVVVAQTHNSQLEERLMKHFYKPRHIKMVDPLHILPMLHEINTPYTYICDNNTYPQEGFFEGAIQQLQSQPQLNVCLSQLLFKSYELFYPLRFEPSTHFLPTFSALFSTHFLLQQSVSNKLSNLWSIPVECSVALLPFYLVHYHLEPNPDPTNSVFYDLFNTPNKKAQWQQFLSHSHIQHLLQLAITANLNNQGGKSITYLRQLTRCYPNYLTGFILLGYALINYRNVEELQSLFKELSSRGEAKIFKKDLDYFQAVLSA